jgi:hypothetical protein
MPQNHLFPPLPMALIAVGAVVHISAPPRMLRVCLFLCVACRAGENGIVGWISVTIAARSCSSMICSPPGVTEGRSRPGCGRMTCCACGREACSLMPRICRASVFSRMTGIAVLRGSGISVINVTQVALHAGMCAGQGKWSRAVIECCSGPGRRIVASCAKLRESRRSVIRIGRAVVIREMARGAGCWKTCINIILMTRCTARTNVGARERKWRIAVIEGRSHKTGCRVAKRTVLREAGLYVIRIGRAVVIREMTRGAGFWKACINIVLMTCSARCASMRAGQWERR